jgi:hypothetical protein
MAAAGQNQKLIDGRLARVVIESEFVGWSNAEAELQIRLRSAKSSYVLGHQSWMRSQRGSAYNFTAFLE